MTSAAVRYALLRFIRCLLACLRRLWSAGRRKALPRVARPPGAGGCDGSALDGDSHGTRRASDDLLGGSHGRRGQVGHLGLRDLADLGGGYRTDLVLVRLRAALLHPGRLLDQFRRRWGLGDEGERAVLENGDLYRDHVPALGLGRSVVLPAEVHDVDSMRAERGADWRRRRGLAGRKLHLDNLRVGVDLADRRRKRGKWAVHHGNRLADRELDDRALLFLLLRLLLRLAREQPRDLIELER